jgi:hypothetical protein
MLRRRERESGIFMPSGRHDGQNPARVLACGVQSQRHLTLDVCAIAGLKHLLHPAGMEEKAARGTEATGF